MSSALAAATLDMYAEEDKVIAKFIEFKEKYGESFEQTVRTNHKTDPKFAFLNDTSSRSHGRYLEKLASRGSGKPLAISLQDKPTPTIHKRRSSRWSQTVGVAKRAVQYTGKAAGRAVSAAANALVDALPAPLSPRRHTIQRRWARNPEAEVQSEPPRTEAAQQRPGLARMLSQPMREVRVLDMGDSPTGSSTNQMSPGIDNALRLRIGTLNCNMLGVQPKDAPRIVAIARAVAVAELDLLHLSELADEATANALLVRVNAASGSNSLTMPTFRMYFHRAAARGTHPVSLALFYRTSALAGGLGLASRMDKDEDPGLRVNLRNPESGEVFDLRMRRGYLFRCTLDPVRFGTRPPLTVAGLHLQSNRGSAFSHYKRMAQARIVRAALQTAVLTIPEEDVVILGDMNSAETDLDIAPLTDEARAGRTAGLAHFTSAVPEAQRTFTLDILRCLDVRTAGYTLANVHADATPTWRRGGEASQLDHILFRIAGVVPNSSAVRRSIEWLPPGVTDHALVVGSFRMTESPEKPSMPSAPREATSRPFSAAGGKDVTEDSWSHSAGPMAPSPDEAMGEAQWPEAQLPEGSGVARLARSLSRGLTSWKPPTLVSMGRMLSRQVGMGGIDLEEDRRRLIDRAESRESVGSLGSDTSIGSGFSVNL